MLEEAEGGNWSRGQAEDNNKWAQQDTGPELKSPTLRPARFGVVVSTAVVGVGGQS